MTAPFAIEPLAGGHDRASFSCGAEALDRYLAAQAMQDQRRRVAGCYVAIEAAGGPIAGYYTIAAASMPLGDVSPRCEEAAALSACAKRPARQACGLYRPSRQGLRRRTPDRCHRAVSAVRNRSLRHGGGRQGETAASFYRHHGFEAFASAPMNLYLPLGTVARPAGGPVMHVDERARAITGQAL